VKLLLRLIGRSLEGDLEFAKIAGERACCTWCSTRTVSDRAAGILLLARRSALCG
jgi:hypothetical protein